jgi:transposase-like protein
MSKKSKKKKPEPIGFTASSEHLLLLKGQPPLEEEKEPSFDELWRQSVEAIKKLEQDHSEKYWGKAAKTKHAPLLYPRRKKDQLEYEKKLTEQGVRVPKAAGSPFLYDGLFQSEAQGIYRSLMEEKLQLHMRVKIKKTTKLKDISKEEKVLFDTPHFEKSTWKKWWPLFLSRFMNKYDGQPEQHSPFYLKVCQVIEGQERPHPLPSDSLYREAIKDKFKTVVKSYANQSYELRW